MPMIVSGRGWTDAALRRGHLGTRQLLAGYGYFFSLYVIKDGREDYICHGLIRVSKLRK